MRRLHRLTSAICLAALLLLAAACGNNTGNEQNGNHGGAPMGSMIEVAASMDPEQPAAGQNVELQAVVTQDGDAVEDASEVKFEIRKQGEDTSEHVLGEHAGNGTYAASYTFPDAGEYFVTAHVTARNMHNMPTIQVSVTE